MLLKKKGFPEDSEIVVCTVTSVQHHSVFVRVDEYGLSGMIHISEIAPGRIRNIRDYVSESKVVVCKVLRVNEERGQVDLSLRRVTETQRRSKINEVKQEQKAEKIIEFVSGKLERDVKDVYKELTDNLLEEYDSLFACFMDVVERDISLGKFKIDKDLARELGDVIKQRLKPSSVEIRGDLTMQSYAPNGVERVKNALKEAVSPEITAKYVAAGRYSLTVHASDFKKAEELLRKSSDAAIKAMREQGGAAEFIRK
jgi:translation initiation factor 2 subunit 1